MESTDKTSIRSDTTPLLVKVIPPPEPREPSKNLLLRAKNISPSLEERTKVLGDNHTSHPLDMPAAYAVRDGGDAKNKKQSMADLKLRRLNELNLRLKEDLDRPRVKVAEASMS